MGLYGLERKISEPQNAPPEIARMAEQIREKHHEHLEGAKIAYVIVPGSPKTKGKTVLGKCREITGIISLVTDADFIIQIPWLTWQGLTDTQRIAVLDHELSHYGADEDTETGAVTYCVLPHDVEEFKDIIARHGFYTEDRMEFGETCAKAHQQSLFAVEEKNKKAAG